jgi:hypothetical protein
VLAVAVGKDEEEEEQVVDQGSLSQN